MQTVRSARRAGMLSRSAMEAARTVSMLSLRHVRMIRTAISPRLAMSTRRTATRLTRLADAQHGLAIFGERAVAEQYLGYRATHPGAHRIHQFHHLDDGNDRLLIDLRPYFHERRGPGLRGTIERAEQW